MIYDANGFDFFNVETLFFDVTTGQSVIDLTGTYSKAPGLGCLRINSGFTGPVRHLTNLPHIIWGHWVYINILGGDIAVCGISVSGPPAPLRRNITVVVELDGSVSVRYGDSKTLLGQTASGLITAGKYWHFGLETVTGLTGSVKLWVNGILKLNLAGVQTKDGLNSNYSDGFQFLGLGGSGSYVHDHWFLLDASAGPNNTFPGMVDVTTGAPTADQTPLQWTPSTPGASYSLISAVPQQSATYIADPGTSGHTSQFQHSTGSLVATPTIVGVVHNIIGELDASGAPITIGSSVNNAAVTKTMALTATQAGIAQPYDTNPNTGLAFALADFTTTFFGPKVA